LYLSIRLKKIFNQGKANTINSQIPPCCKKGIAVLLFLIVYKCVIYHISSPNSVLLKHACLTMLGAQGDVPQLCTLGTMELTFSLPAHCSCIRHPSQLLQPLWSLPLSTCSTCTVL
jgi:hypothetical protein